MKPEIKKSRRTSISPKFREVMFQPPFSGDSLFAYPEPFLQITAVPKVETRWDEIQHAQGER